MVAPSRVWQENGLGVLVELGQEFSSNPQSTSSRDGLARGNLFIPTDDAEQGKKGKEKGKRKKRSVASKRNLRRERAYVGILGNVRAIGELGGGLGELGETGDAEVLLVQVLLQQRLLCLHSDAKRSRSFMRSCIALRKEEEEEILKERAPDLADTREHKRLTLVISVGSHTKVHLAGILVLLEGL